MNAYLAAFVRPVIVCLVAGGLKTLQDYQTTNRWVPSLVDGGITAGLAATAMLGVNGAQAGLQTAATKASAAKAAPVAPPTA